MGVENFNTCTNGVFNIGKNMAYYYAIMMIVFNFFVYGGFIAVSYFSTNEVENGDLTAGQVSAYMLYNWQMVFNMMMLNNNL